MLRLFSREFLILLVEQLSPPSPKRFLSDVLYSVPDLCPRAAVATADNSRYRFPASHTRTVLDGQSAGNQNCRDQAGSVLTTPSHSHARDFVRPALRTTCCR